MELIKWKKPGGQVIETNDMNETIEYCMSLDWEMVGSDKEIEPEAKPIKKKK